MKDSNVFVPSVVVWMRFPLTKIDTLNHRICAYVTLCGKRDFADLIKVKELELGRSSG